MSQRVQYQVDTASSFVAENPLLELNEWAIEKDTGRQKIGDGVTRWIDLPYIGADGFIRNGLINRAFTASLVASANRNPVTITASPSVTATLTPTATISSATSGAVSLTATGSVTAIASTDTPPSSETEFIVTNVKDYGATGNGSTDDTTAIKNAITAAGAGGVVYFPKGTYLVSSTLNPLSGQRWAGEHVPKYQISDSSGSTCTIQAKATFTGRALIEGTSNVTAVLFERLCLMGLGETDASSLDGIHTGDWSGERSWIVNFCTIRRFSGNAIAGRLHVFDIRDSHIVRCGYGLRTTGTNAITDMRIEGSQFYYNLHGGICLDSTTRNGMLSINTTRVERTGSTPGNPAVMRDSAAPGIRISNSVNIDLVQVSTDANAGPGLHVLGNRSGGTYVTALSVVGCNFARDGGGDQSVGVQVPGIKIVQGDHILFTGNSVIWGQQDDAGGGPIVPYWMLWLEDTYHSVFTANWTVANTTTNSIHMVGSNWRTKVDDVFLGFDCLRPAADSERLTANIPVGASYFSTTSNRPKYWDGSTWRNADGTTG